jgi:hypothetical protein
MPDYRLGTVVHPSGGIRFGDITYQAFAERLVLTSSGFPGEPVTVSLNGTWDAGGKTATLNGVALSVSA